MADRNKRRLDKTTHKRVVREETRGARLSSNPSVERTRFLQSIPTSDKEAEHGRMPPLQTGGRLGRTHTLRVSEIGGRKKTNPKKMGIVLNPENILQTMLEREEQWRSVQSLSNK